MNATATEGAKRLQPYIDPEDLLWAAVELFAARPSLAHELLDLRGRKVIGDEPSALLNYLFECPAEPALGADDNILRYRLRDAHHRNLVDGAAHGNLSNLDHVTVPRCATEAMVAAAYWASLDDDIPLVWEKMIGAWLASEQGKLVQGQR
jgi:hypothetical protein